jgi:hypothetical protein
MADKKEKKKKPTKWIQEAELKEGNFTRKAERKGITSAQLQENVLSSPGKYDDTTVKQANLRKTLVGLHQRKKQKTPED